VAVIERAVSVEFVFDRTGAQSLARAYRMLVPERRARAVPRGDGDGDQSSIAGGDASPTQRRATADDRRERGA
jgi:hypothetical protein